MQINISEDTLQEELDKATSKAVSDAFGDYSVREALSKQLAGRVVGEALAQAMEKAMASLDIDAMAQNLAAVLMRTTVEGTTNLLESQVVELVYAMEQRDRYARDEEKKILKAQIRARLRGEEYEPAVPTWGVVFYVEGRVTSAQLWAEAVFEGSFGNTVDIPRHLVAAADSIRRFFADEDLAAAAADEDS